MKLIKLYKEFTNPRGFDNGESAPAGVCEARDIIIGILNKGLGETPWEAYALDETLSSLHRNKYRIEFRKKRDYHINEPPLDTNAIDILKDAESDWEVLNGVSIIRRRPYDGKIVY